MGNRYWGYNSAERIKEEATCGIFNSIPWRCWNCLCGDTRNPYPFRTTQDASSSSFRWKFVVGLEVHGWYCWHRCSGTILAEGSRDEDAYWFKIRFGWWKSTSRFANRTWKDISTEFAMNSVENIVALSFLCYLFMYWSETERRIFGV